MKKDCDKCVSATLPAKAGTSPSWPNTSTSATGGGSSNQSKDGTTFPALDSNGDAVFIQAIYDEATNTTSYQLRDGMPISNFSPIVDAVVPDKEITYQLYRLNGGSLNATASPFVDGFTDGIEGQSVTVLAGYLSLAVSWERETQQDAEVTIGDWGKRAGAAVGTAGYIPIMPQLTDNGANEFHGDDLVITAGSTPTAYVDVLVKRYK